jgi:CheY-like chemotaxis protein
MTPKVAERAFEPFFTTKDVGKGTGLGLSMVYGFARQSGGHVKIYSEPGVGTAVKIYLPVTRSPTEIYRPATYGIPKGRGELILVVEDDEDVRSMVCGKLASLNYRTVDAATGTGALDLLAGLSDIAMLFTDVILRGGMNGAQLAAAARASRPGLPVLYTSGYTENAIIHHGRLDPGVQLLSKPYSLAALATAIEKALRAVSPAESHKVSV